MTLKWLKTYASIPMGQVRILNLDHATSTFEIQISEVQIAIGSQNNMDLEHSVRLYSKCPKSECSVWETKQKMVWFSARSDFRRLGRSVRSV